MNKADAVIRKLEEKNKVFRVKFLGNKKNKADGFCIMMLNQGFTCVGDLYYGLTQDTLDLLKEADIDFKIVGRGDSSGK